MDYLVLTNEVVASQAKRKMEANFLRFRSDWQNGKGYGKALKNLSGPDVDPDGKTDDELLDSAQLVMMGEKAGKLNTTDGFTYQWSGDPVQRLTDSKYCFPLPEAGSLRDALLQSVPQPNSIETDPEDGTWFPIEEV